MSFLPALQSGDYTKARKASYAGAQYCSQLPNTVVFAAQLNGSASAASFLQNTWHNATVGAYTDALVGQLLLISHTNDKTQAYFTGRVRDVFDGANIYFNETSINQTVDDYFWVIDDYPVMDKLIAFDIANSIYLVDGSETYHDLKPIIGSAAGSVGLKAVYAGFVDDISSLFRISLSAKFEIGPSSGTITAWSLDILDGTLISGSLSGSGTTTGTIVVDFPAGFRHILLSATNSAGQTSTLAIKVWSETRTGSATLVVGHNGSSLTFDVSSPGALQSCNLDVTSTELQSTLNNTPLCVWDEEYLDGALGSVGGNVRFVGRLRRENNQAKADLRYVRTLSTKWTLEGPDTQLNRLENFKTFKIENAASPAEWGQINSLTPYNAIWLLLSEFTTFANSNVINLDAYDSTFPYVSFAVQGSTMLAIVNDLGMSINAQMMFSGDGRSIIARHAFYLTTTQRNNLTTVGDFGDSDRRADFSLSLDDIRSVAQVDAWGGEWVGGDNITPLHSMAAGIARDVGERSIPISKQILANVGAVAAQNELSDRAGCHWFKEAYQQRLSIPHTPGYGFLIPDISAWYTWTVASVDNLRNYSYTTSTRWILEKVTQNHDNKAGGKKVDGTYRQETNGLGLGKAIAIVDNSANVLPSSFPISRGFFSSPRVTPQIVPPGPQVRQMAKGLKQFAAPCSDGTRKLTSTFDQTVAGSLPSWASASMGVSGTPLLWVVDVFSTRFNSSTGKTYGWLITTTGIYYGELNTPSFTLFYTFRATSSLRSADASRRQVGHIVVVTDYSDGTYATYATTGGNFVSEFSVGTGGGSFPPGAAYSLHVNNQAFTSINGTGKKSTNGGSSYSTDSTIDPGSDCATEIALPYNNNPLDTIKYYGKRGGTTPQTFNFKLSDYDYITVPSTWSPEPSWASGDGWIYGNDLDGLGTYHRSVNIWLNPASIANVIRIDMYYNMTVGTFPVGPGPDVRIVIDGSIVASINNPDIVSGDNQVLTWIGSPTNIATSLQIVASSSNSLTLGGLNGSCTITKVVLTVNNSSGSLIRQNGSTSTDITPSTGFAPWQSRGQIAISPTNPNIVVCCAGDSGLTQTGVWVSKNAGLSWTAISGPSGSNPYTRCFFSEDGKNILYLVGTNGAIGYSSDLSTIISKKGNLSTSATVLGISAL